MEFPLTQEEIQGLLDRQRVQIQELETQLAIAHSQLQPMGVVVSRMEQLTIQMIAAHLYQRHIIIDDREEADIREQLTQALAGAWQ
jgi:hypothetical protein